MILVFDIDVVNMGSRTRYVLFFYLVWEIDGIVEKGSMKN